jgi:hypothetical protein
MPDLNKLPLLAEISDSTESEEPEDIDVIGVSEDESPDVHVSRAGIGSVYWAARHPSQAWRIFAPLAADAGTRLFRDVTIRCEMVADRSEYETGCP